SGVTLKYSNAQITLKMTHSAISFHWAMSEKNNSFKSIVSSVLLFWLIILISNLNIFFPVGNTALYQLAGIIKYSLVMLIRVSNIPGLPVPQTEGFTFGKRPGLFQMFLLVLTHHQNQIGLFNHLGIQLSSHMRAHINAQTLHAQTGFFICCMSYHARNTGRFNL